jgi:hypothetical protein
MSDYKQLQTYYNQLYAQLREGHRQAIKLEREVESEQD